MPQTTFFEIILRAEDFAFDGRDDVEDPLAEALEAAGLGEVTGGGGGMGVINLDVEVTDPERGLALVREVLVSLGVAPSTVIQRYEPQRVTYPVYLRAGA